MAGDSAEKASRLYFTPAGPELTVNARWSSGEWHKDIVDNASKVEVRTQRLRLFMEASSATSFTDTEWTGQLDCTPDPESDTFLKQNGEIEAYGDTESYVTYWGYTNGASVWVGSGFSHRKEFPGVPSSVSFTLLGGAVNISAGPWATYKTAFGGTAYGLTVASGSYASFRARVHASF